jgi:hypothetical protein
MFARTGEDEKFVYYIASFQGARARGRVNKITKEVFFNADDMVKIFGLGNTAKEFFSSDKGLDWILEFKKENPDKPIFCDNREFTVTVIKNL